jgi:mRNA interferase MazF
VVAPPNVPRRGDVFLISLDPTIGREIKKTRPCVIVSPDELNEHLSTFLVAPLTTGGFRYPFRIACTFQKKSGHIVLDQVRTIDRRRLVKRLGRVAPATLEKALETLQEMFAP